MSTKLITSVTLGAALLAFAGVVQLRAQGQPRAAASAAGPAAADGPRFSAAGLLQRPEDYREWNFVTTGLGMTYGPTQPAAGAPRFFDNVFVSRASYREFVKTGKWPDKTMFVLEIRSSESKASIDNGGVTQGGRVMAIEAAVKDVNRFKDTGGWGYFDFGGGTELKAEMAALPKTATCYQCHATNTAVENTFVQFYPTLFEVAQKMGTVKPTYDPNHKVGAQ